MMNFERLTARNKDGIAYLVNVKPDEQEVDSPHKNTLQCILDCFERLAQYEDEAIARQSETEKVVCPYCGGKDKQTGECRINIWWRNYGE